MYLLPTLSRPRGLSLLAVGTLVLGLAAPVAIPQAAQAATCSGSGCNNKDPQAYGCNSGTTTVDTITAYSYVQAGGGNERLGTVTASLRASAKCGHVAWMRIPGKTNLGPMPKFRVQSCTLLSNGECSSTITTRSTFPNCQPSDDDPFACGADDPWWSNTVMANTRRVRICGASVTRTDDGNKTGPWGCTPWQFTP
jgi:hypothetical protein